MKKIFFLFSVTLLIVAKSVSAQTPIRGGTIQDLVDPKMVNPELLHSKSENTKGFVYFGHEWAPGTVIDKQGKVHEGLTLSYHNYQDNLYMKNGDKIVMVNKTLVDKFTLLVGTKQYLFVSTPLNSQDVYAEPIYNGKTKLFRLHQKIIESRGSSYNEQLFQVYTDKPVLLIQPLGEKVVEFKMNKKSMLATFPDKVAAIEEYWKKEKNKFKTENDLVNTLKFLDSMAK